MDLLTLAVAKQYTDKQMSENQNTIPTKTSQLTNDSGFLTDNGVFIAEYGVTTYEEVLKAVQEKKHVYLNYRNERFSSLSRVDGDVKDGQCNFLFTCFENTFEHSYLIQYATKEWSYYSCDCGSYIRQFNSDIKRIDSIIQGLQKTDSNTSNNIQTINTNINNLNSNVTTINKNVNSLLPLLTSSLNCFKGGFRSTAGVLDIKCPGLYLVTGGGTGNKNIIITQNGEEVLNETWNGAMVFSSDDGIITPIGIKSSLTLTGTFETPGTYQGWTPDGTHHTRISYPELTVIWYLGNTNNDVGTWN